MIKVTIKKNNSDGRIQHITVEGHANYDNSGKDIVCSAVSALTIGAVNSTEILLNIALNPELDTKNGGFLSWSVPEIGEPRTDEHLQLLMKAMVESLLMIEEDYKKYLKIYFEAS